MGDLYAWLKVGHLAALIAWMAALFYLPRLFVYHVDAPVGSAQSETFKVMERRLLKAIMTPAMIATWIFGLALAWQGGWFSDGWLHGKLALVLALSGFHGACAKWLKDFAADRNTRPGRFYRIANEVPTILMILILILVVVKPF
ncbi:protoporphyrinogen oxidase HemJ [Chthonobacter albigriseus]|uniref:protoporphyrinogen oxidase HemJ n=1 Tax=Chthonobacter albigriseus TaxID=1683161 RepID=UPI0015EF725D|nr:protoporphyrinogen oxidase HemJ [Chthonobacter albigriseus]